MKQACFSKKLICPNLWGNKHKQTHASCPESGLPVPAEKREAVLLLKGNIVGLGKNNSPKTPLKPLGLGLQYKLLLITLLLTRLTFTTAQQSMHQVSGTITDSSGAPIPGVNIIVNKMPSVGVISNADGYYSLINIGADAVLKFSFIGFKIQEIPVNGRTTINVVLQEEVMGLNEVIVLGYGEQKIKHVTYAAKNVDLNKINDLAALSLGTLLRDQIPGVSVSGGDGRPGESASVTIRQTFSLSKDGGNSNPLVVIDDVPQVDVQTGMATLGTLNNLTIDEIESITILKDGAAAIYGSRASQGAIIVKTKQGEKGTAKISYSGKFVTNDAISHSKVLNTYEYGLFANSYLRAKGVTSASSLFSDEELEQMKSLNYNWLSNAWHSSQTLQHSLSVSGGTDKITYYTGASYSTQTPNMGSEDYKRWNFRTNITASLAKNLKLSVSLSATKSDKDALYTKVLGSLSDGSYGAKVNGKIDYSYLHHIPGYIPFQYEIDKVNYWVSPALGPQYVSSSVNANRTIGTWNYFSIANSGSRNINDSGSYNFNISLAYDIPFIKGLSIRGSYARSFSSSANEQIQTPYALALATNTNQQGMHLYGDYTNWTTGKVTTNSRVVYSDSQGGSYQANAYLNFQRQIGRHSITAMASVEQSESDERSAQQLYENPLEPYQGTNATAGTLDQTNSYVYRYEAGTLSYLGRVSYAYADKYLAQFLVRSDASTKFAPENYWGTFPSASFGWVLSQEEWFKQKIGVIDFLKLRYSVGLTGKDNLKGWKWMQTYKWDGNKGYQLGSASGGVFADALIPGASPNRKATWDKCFKQDWGIDASILNARLDLSYDFFYNRSYNMLKSRSQEVGTPISVGGAVAEENFAAINDWGHEVSVSWHDKINEFRYSVGINFSFGYNNVVKKYIDTGIQYPAYNSVREGYSTIFPQWGFKVWRGTSTGDGMLRTQEDIDKYWSYLSANAVAAGTTPKYFSVTDPTSLKPGMLAYSDLGGDLNEDGTQKGPNGQIVETQDYGKLVKRARGKGFSLSLGASWRSFDIRTSINTSWGTFRMIDLVGQNSKKDLMLWNRESFWANMFDSGVTTIDENGQPTTAYANPNGKYPNLGLDYVTKTSDFWQVSGFRCYVRSLTIGYKLPKKYTTKIGVNSVRVNISGNNLWDFYNPYPDKYRNMYDTSYDDFPTLRSWLFGVNVSF